MARFIGTFEEFENFIGPKTNKIVTKLGKELRQQQKSCQNNTQGIDGEYCGKYKLLDAAHFSHKNRDRKSMIKGILDKTFKEGDEYNVDINRFIKLFEEEHYPLLENLIMLCRKHHAQYDRKNKNVTYVEEKEEKLEEVLDVHTPLDFKKHSKEIKKEIIEQIEYLTNDETSIARLSHNSWNFNIKKEQERGWLLAFNQYDSSITILKYDLGGLDISALIKKNKKELSLNIPFSEETLIEKKTNYLFEIIDTFQIAEE